MYYPLKILSFVVPTGSTIALNQLCPTAARGPHAAQSKVLCGPV